MNLRLPKHDVASRAEGVYIFQPRLFVVAMLPVQPGRDCMLLVADGSKQMLDFLL